MASAVSIAARGQISRRNVWAEFPRLDEVRVVFQKGVRESWRLYETSGPLEILATHCNAKPVDMPLEHGKSLETRHCA